MISLFYSIIIGDGNVYEADWVPVSIGFAIACAILLLFVPYNLFVGNKLLKSAASSIQAAETTDDALEKPEVEKERSEHTEL